MDADQIKKTVVDGYARIATADRPDLFACCGASAAEPDDVVKQVGRTIGYADDELDRAPEGSNLGVGCGNPGALAHIREGDTVLDLGSGAGFDAFLAAPRVGVSGRVIGVDLGDDMLALARKNADACGFENVTFLKGDIEALPIESASVDRILSNCVINLAPDKRRVFAEAHRVLRPGGTFHISDIVLTAELPDAVKQSDAGLIACVSGAESLDAYLGYATAAGFENVQIDAEADFPLELVLTDPVARQVLAELALDDERIEAIRSSVKSISMSGLRP